MPFATLTHILAPPHCFESALLVFSHFTSIPRHHRTSLVFPLVSLLIGFCDSSLILLLGYWELSRIHLHTLRTVVIIHSRTRAIRI